MRMIKEFKDFAMKGNVIQIAAGIIIGGAFGKIISSLVNDIIMPPIGKLMGGVDFGELFINLSNVPYNTLTLAREAGAPTINYGAFINTIINFAIIAFSMFIIVKVMNLMKKKEAEVPKVALAPAREEILLTEIRDLLAKK